MYDENIFDAVKRRVSALEVGRAYGLNPDRSGKCLCPFHSERHASFQLYDGYEGHGKSGYYCFGACKDGGDVVKLTAKLLGLEPLDAAKRLNEDFNLGLTFTKRRRLTYNVNRVTDGKVETEETEPEYMPRDFSDAGNAELFAELYRDRACHCTGLGWLYWNRNVWERSDDKVLGLAVDFSYSMLTEAQELYRQKCAEFAELEAATDTDAEALDEAKTAKKAAKKYLDHAKSTRARQSRITAILTLAKPRLKVEIDELDVDAHFLNMPIAVLNLATGELMHNEPEMYCTKITNFSRSDKGEQEWQTFLDRITCGDVELKNFLQIVIGMSLFGRVYEEKLIVAVGEGSNGKSTFLGAVAEVLGTYAQSFDIDVLTRTRNADFKREAASMRGARLVLGGELEHGAVLSESTLKRLVSRDRTHGEYKFEDGFDFVPSHSVIIHTNHLPRVTGTDKGTWRRLLVVPFNAEIPEKESDPDFLNKLVDQCGGAILAWATEGAKRFADNGYKLGNLPFAVLRATENYRHEEDTVLRFLESCTSRDPGAKVRSTDLYAEYAGWCETENEAKLTARDFRKSLESEGIVSKHTRDGWFCAGIRLDKYRMKTAV